MWGRGGRSIKLSYKVDIIGQFHRVPHDYIGWTTIKYNTWRIVNGVHGLHHKYQRLSHNAVGGVPLVHATNAVIRESLLLFCSIEIGHFVLLFFTQLAPFFIGKRQNAVH